MTPEPVPVRPEHTAALTLHDDDPELVDVIERELPEWEY